MIVIKCLINICSQWLTMSNNKCLEEAAACVFFFNLFILFSLLAFCFVFFWNERYGIKFASRV